MTKFYLITFFITLSILPFNKIQAQVKELEGVIIDGKTNEPLPFATISFRNYNIGTVADQDGRYFLTVKPALQKDTLTVSYIGYKNTSFVIGASNFQKIILTPDVYQLQEIVIRPISAEDFIREVIREIPNNYMDVPFKTLSYYKKRYDENDIPIEYVEAIFSSYQFPYLLDSSNQHRLALHKVKAQAELQFQKSRADQRKVKARKKAQKKREEFDEEESYSPINVNFLGPEGVLKGDPVRNLSNFLDSTNFKKYTFEFHETTVYNDLAVEIIQYKGKVDQLKAEGLIYVDKQSFAIIKIVQNGKHQLSLALKALLYAMGFSLENGLMNREIKYKSFQNKWYPENLISTLEMDLVKHNMFSKNESAHLDLEQIFSTMQIATDGITPISEDQRYDNDKEMEEQVFPMPNLDWDIMK